MEFKQFEALGEKMNKKQIGDVLDKVTLACRKTQLMKTDKVVVKSKMGKAQLTTTQIQNLPLEREVIGKNTKTIDCFFCNVVVQEDILKDFMSPMIEILSEWPKQDSVKKGLTFREILDELQDTGLALRFMALGQALEMWTIQTPEDFGFSGDVTNTMAENGYLGVTGWQPASL